MRAIARLGGPLLLALASSSCQRAAPELRAPVVAAAVARPAPEPARPVDAVSHPLELVPADARRVLVIPSALRFAAAWERERLAKQFPSQYEGAREVVRWTYGLDVLDPEGLARMGVDPAAPLVFASLHEQHPATALLGKVSDAERLLEVAAAREGASPIEPVTVGDARVARIRDGLAVVLRKDVFAWVSSGPAGTDFADHADIIARLDPATSLARSTLLERAGVDPSRGADLLGVLDLAAIRRDQDAYLAGREPELRAMIDAYRPPPDRAPGDELPELAAQRAFRETVQRVGFEGPMMLEVLAARADVIGLELNADERGVRGQLHVEHDDAALRSLLEPGDRPPLPMAALGDAPLLLLGARVDLDVAAELLAGLVPAAPSVVPPGVLVELRPLLDGSIALAIMATPAPAPEPPPDPGTLLTTTLALGLVDEDRARALLDAWIERWPGRRLKPAPELHGYALETDGWPRTLWIGVLDGWLVTTTDPSVLRDFRSKRAAAASPSWPWPPDRAGRAFLAAHHRLPFLDQWALLPLFLRSEDISIDEHLAMFEFPDDDLAAIPRSARARRLERAYERLRREQERAELREEQRWALERWKAAEALGLTTAVVRTTDSGFTIELSHDVPLGRWVEAQLGMLQRRQDERGREMARIRDRSRSSAVDPLDEAKRRAVDARRKDVERALGRKSRFDQSSGDWR